MDFINERIDTLINTGDITGLNTLIDTLYDSPPPQPPRRRRIASTRCPCGGAYTENTLAAHLNTGIHRRFMARAARPGRPTPPPPPPPPPPPLYNTFNFPVLDSDDPFYMYKPKPKPVRRIKRRKCILVIAMPKPVRRIKRRKYRLVIVDKLAVVVDK